MLSRLFCEKKNEYLSSQYPFISEIVSIFDMANACRWEFEGSDGGAVVKVVGVDGQQVLEVVALDAAGLLAAVGHQPACKNIMKHVLKVVGGKVNYGLL